jgi:phage-related protein
VPARRKRAAQVSGRRWRVYTARSGRSPVRDFIATLTDVEAADVAAAMSDVRRNGVRAAKHVEGEIYEVKADSERQTFRILFAQEGARDQVLLALEGFSKKQQRLPRGRIDLAQRRLRDWRSRGR